MTRRARKVRQREGVSPCPGCDAPRHKSVGVMPCPRCGHVNPRATCHYCGLAGSEGHKPKCAIVNIVSWTRGRIEEARSGG